MGGRQLFIGIDSGTQGTKGIVLDLAMGDILAEAYAPHGLVEKDDGTREQDPAWWIAACDKVIRELVANPAVTAADIKGIGISGQQHGFVPLDKNGLVIRKAKLWCDTATTAQCDAISDAVGDPTDVVDAIGNSVAAGFTASKVRWLMDHEPENYDRLDTILLPHDYINFWLTGEKKTEFGDASGTAYFDVANRKWSDTLLNAIDPSGKLADCLPELIESDMPVGCVRPELAAKYGFGKEVLVASGGGDNMMAAIGTGNVKPGVVTASLGTSGTIYAYSDSPVIDPKGELAAFCSSSGGWLPLVCTMNVTVATELTKNLLGIDTRTLNRQAEQSCPGSNGVMVLPYFNGERTPALPNATASLHGLTSANFTPGNLCRAAMEGATFGLRYGLNVMKNLGVAPTGIRLVGGGANSPLWQQLVADIFGCPVVRPKTAEAGALGAAIQAIWCSMHYLGENIAITELADRYVAMDATSGATPNQKAVNLYNNLYEQYMALNDTLWKTNG
jgi:xylulokinase